MVWRSRIEKADTKVYPFHNYRLLVTGWPSRDAPVIAVQVQREFFSVASAVRIQKKFKKYESGKYEIVPNTEKKKRMYKITGEAEWKPASGVVVEFRIESEGRGRTVTTDEDGMARFDVSGYAERWVEGKDLAVEVRARLKGTAQPVPWETLKDKHPKVMNDLEIVEKDFVEKTEVSKRTLQRIFDAR